MPDIHLHFVKQHGHVERYKIAPKEYQVVCELTRPDGTKCNQIYTGTNPRKSHGEHIVTEHIPGGKKIYPCGNRGNGCMTRFKRPFERDRHMRKICKFKTPCKCNVLTPLRHTPLIIDIVLRSNRLSCLTTVSTSVYSGRTHVSSIAGCHHTLRFLPLASRYISLHAIPHLTYPPSSRDTLTTQHRFSHRRNCSPRPAFPLHLIPRDILPQSLSYLRNLPVIRAVF